MNTATTFGDRLLLARRYAKLDQKELGRRANVSNTYISDLENGRVTNPGIEVVFALANALGMSVAELLGLPTPGPVDEEDLPAYLTRTHIVQKIESTQTRYMAQRFLELFLALSQRDQSLLLRMAETIADSSQPRIIGEEEEKGDGTV